MLLDLRPALVEQGHSETVWNVGMKAWAFSNVSPRRFNWGGQLAAKASRALHLQTLPGPLAGWTEHRTMPSFAPKSFHQLWQERQKKGDDHDTK
jgi:L-lactate dehydrogenase complex protein LldF